MKGVILMFMAPVTASKIQQEKGRIPLPAQPRANDRPPLVPVPATNEKLPPLQTSLSPMNFCSKQHLQILPFLYKWTLPFFVLIGKWLP